MNSQRPQQNWLALVSIGNAVATGIILLLILVGLRAPVSDASSNDTGSKDTAAQGSTISEAEVQQIAAQVIPRGTPFYGAELSVSYDRAEEGIKILGQFDDLGSKPIKLTGEKLERYKKIGQSISCEYCCGAAVMTKPDGTPACGCAHSQAMRGVALYLLDKYGDTKSDQEIFDEVAKWKALSFPQDTVKKALALSKGSQQSGGALNALPQQQGGC